MTSTVVKLHSSTVLALAPNPTRCHAHSRLPTSYPRLLAPYLRLLTPRPTSLALRSNFTSSLSSRYTESVVSPTPLPPSVLQWNLTHRHILLLNVIASAVAISATWLFVSAIPALLAFKRAAESLEKLMDVTREELPDTMAAVRLSGMEISDLTMELSDLGQEITQGVKGSTKAVRLAEERLRLFTNMVPLASLQRVEYPRMTEAGRPALARSARGMKERIVMGRSLLQVFLTVTRFSRMMLNYLAKRTKK